MTSPLPTTPHSPSPAQKSPKNHPHSKHSLARITILTHLRTTSHAHITAFTLPTSLPELAHLALNLHTSESRVKDAETQLYATITALPLQAIDTVILTRARDIDLSDAPISTAIQACSSFLLALVEKGIARRAAGWLLDVLTEEFGGELWVGGEAEGVVGERGRKTVQMEFENVRGLWAGSAETGGRAIDGGFAYRVLVPGTV
ncbi:hypothetical protein P153DRAFT_362050 [Dothidotthia symphoricarpi CBS 119687]|uniref:Uncharacterized protein n=1 Tax=Dothidotthia symphoricarpi CBS 119687 TaxID=1392245 RepID=A0A6A5ZUU1_9PLEO|nr:uncharacterized protein P153DRAFT_362050 [Dothidotthia symphoricarpi CBS 119687]KAF2123492.1 hypothetical protein P153DRAFT_362050 [Dothidotthia symphoricarpi CBS 119687]